jgi:hypothetical protein
MIDEKDKTGYKKRNSDLAKEAIEKRWKPYSKGEHGANCNFCKYYMVDDSGEFEDATGSCLNEFGEPCPLEEKKGDKFICCRVYYKWRDLYVEYGVDSPQARKAAKDMIKRLKTLIIED